MPPLSSIIVGLQGIFGILNGATSLLLPSAAQKNTEILKIPSIPAIHAIAAGSVSIGYVNFFVSCILLCIRQYLPHGKTFIHATCTNQFPEPRYFRNLSQVLLQVAKWALMTRSRLCRERPIVAAQNALPAHLLA